MSRYKCDSPSAPFGPVPLPLLFCFVLFCFSFHLISNTRFISSHNTKHKIHLILFTSPKITAQDLIYKIQFTTQIHNIQFTTQIHIYLCHISHKNCATTHITQIWPRCPPRRPCSCVGDRVVSTQEEKEEG
jgi:hypothetical protein